MIASLKHPILLPADIILHCLRKVFFLLSFRWAVNVIRKSLQYNALYSIECTVQYNCSDSLTKLTAYLNDKKKNFLKLNLHKRVCTIEQWKSYKFQWSTLQNSYYTWTWIYNFCQQKLICRYTILQRVFQQFLKK